MSDEIKKPTRKELIEMLDEMNLNIEKLPMHVMTSPVMHYDLSALLILLSAIFKAEDSSSSKDSSVLDCK